MQVKSHEEFSGTSARRRREGVVSRWKGGDVAGGRRRNPMVGFEVFEFPSREVNWQANEMTVIQPKSNELRERERGCS